MRILLVEDDADLRVALLPVLKNAGYTVDFCPDGEEAALLLSSSENASIYDVCIFDRMLPGLDGLTLLRKVRSKGLTVPILMLTALAETSDKVEGLDSGANDYLAKPFDNRELIARLRAMSRTCIPQAQVSQYVCGDICYRVDSLTLEGPNKVIQLSLREGALLEVLCKHPNKVQSRSFLLGCVWGPLSEASDASLDNYIHFVRRRLSAVGSRIRIITVHGLGYKLEVGGEA